MTRVALFALVVAVLLTAIGGIAFAGIKGSKHDFSTPAWEGVDRCGVCHTPDRKDLPKVPPLWNTRADLTRRFGRSLASRNAAGTGTMTLLGHSERSQLADSDPGMGTRACLRCHDGTVARDATGAALGKHFRHNRHPGRFAAGHGRTDHPVGVDYPRIDERFHPVSAVQAGWKVRLPDGKVECSSCHDPHNESGEPAMLVMSNRRSALCLKCHKK